MLYNKFNTEVDEIKIACVGVILTDIDGKEIVIETFKPEKIELWA